MSRLCRLHAPPKMTIVHPPEQNSFHNRLQTKRTVYGAHPGTTRSRISAASQEVCKDPSPIRPGSTEVRFLDGGQISAQPVKNAITAVGRNFSPANTSTFELLNAVIEVLPETGPFVRGNWNGDASGSRRPRGNTGSDRREPYERQ